jgi:cell wall-associated NlpC family hydrolase
MRTVRTGATACLVLALCSPGHACPALHADTVPTAVSSSLPSAYAEPAPSKREVRRARHTARERTEELGTASAELAGAQSRLDELTSGVERLVEAYNGEMVRLRRASDLHEQARARLGAADAEVERARQAVAVLAAEVYTGNDLTMPQVLMLNDTGDTDGYLHRASVLEHLGSERAAVLTRMLDAQKVSDILRRQASAAHAEQEAAAQRARLAKLAAERAVAGQRRETRLLERERDALEERVEAARSRAERLARARQEALEAARQARLQRVRALGGHKGLVAGGSMAGDLAANWALTQLGKPYVWAADGPASYDCSGLTMRAWERAGVGLDHWTGTQWTSGPHVPLDQLRRGDLLFFGHISDDPGTIHHVGIYVGKGLMVHAPQTGDVVRVASIWRSDLVGATRPADVSA